jgi:hypothetical protein
MKRAHPLSVIAILLADDTAVVCWGLSIEPAEQ